MKVPFNRPTFPPAAADYIAEAVRNEHLSGDGPFSKQCETWVEDWSGAPRCLLTSSCTSALEMSLLLAEIQPGDEVILPSFTFVSCANAVVLRGAIPVFADIEPDSLSVSANTIEPLITKNTRAVMAVHYGGHGPAVTEIAELSSQHGIVLIEDSAHVFLGKAMGRPYGTFGSMGAFSFHETKNFSMGEGGAILINDPNLVERAEIIREKGTNRRQFFKGLVDKYSWVDVGSSYVPSDLLAAMLWSQLQIANEINTARQLAWHHYYRELSHLVGKQGLTLPMLQAEGSTFHTFALQLADATTRDTVLRELQRRGVGAVFHYLPLERSPFGERFLKTPCPVSESVSSRLIRLPLFAQISEAEIEFVCREVGSVLESL